MHCVSFFFLLLLEKNNRFRSSDHPDFGKLHGSEALEFDHRNVPMKIRRGLPPRGGAYDTDISARRLTFDGPKSKAHHHFHFTLSFGNDISQPLTVAARVSSCNGMLGFLYVLFLVVSKKINFFFSGCGLVSVRGSYHYIFSLGVGVFLFGSFCLCGS